MGVFLDLPMPWLAVPHLDRCVVEGGKICCFSPCIEQVDKTAAELRRGGRYCDIRMFETLASNWGVREEGTSNKRQKMEDDGSEGGEDGSEDGRRRKGKKGKGKGKKKDLPNKRQKTEAVVKDDEAESSAPRSWVSYP